MGKVIHDKGTLRVSTLQSEGSHTTCYPGPGPCDDENHGQKQGAYQCVCVCFLSAIFSRIIYVTSMNH